ncbi:MAG: tRNA 2-thiouridine(34) synthase MnmA [Bacteroidota bacterium]
MKKVVVGISGGVDSSVSAYLLKQQGYDVVGLFMINWHDTTGTLEGDCPWEDDLLLAKLVARKLDIPLHTVDLSDEYRKRVVNYMFSEYEKGRTPNPDVLCNREVKFDLFVKEALNLGADYVATGHYCRKDEEKTANGLMHRLLAGRDLNKEQSYFLCQLSQEQLSKALFPVGGIHKHEVRKIAEEQDLATATRKDSQGICFVGKVDLPTFLQQKLEPRRGRIIEVDEDWYAANKKIVDVEDAEKYTDKELINVCTPHQLNPGIGKQVGLHNGAHFYTLGQNKGLNIGGRPKPSFVIALDTKKNLLYTGLGKEHAGLYRPGLMIANKEVHWIRPDKALKPGESAKYNVRIRYRQPLQKARLIQRKDNLFIIFDRPQRSITPGQFAAWYKDEELLGSGPILI